MAHTGYKDPGTAAEVARAGSGGTWNNENNAKSDDGSYADSAISKTAYSNWLRLTKYDFSSIPAGSTLDGIIVRVDRYGNAASVIQDSSLRLILSGVIKGVDKASASWWPTVAAAVTYGGAADTWTSGLTIADIKNAGFGVQISAYNAHASSVRIAYVDVMQIDIYYTEPPPTAELRSALMGAKLIVGKLI